MHYLEFKSRQDFLNKQLRTAVENLKSINSGKIGPMGLTPDHVKESSDYITARQYRDAAFRDLRSFNSKYISDFYKEIRADRDAARELRKFSSS